MTASPWRGIFPIPVTPFDSGLRIVPTDLRRQVEFCVDAGAHGIVYPGVVSEFFTLSESERRAATEVVVDAADGRVPVVVGVAGTSAPIAEDLARHAAGCGAAGVMAMTPYVPHFFSATSQDLVRYYAGIAKAGLPIVLQNARIGKPIGIGALPDLVRAVPAIRYLKQETAPATHELGAVISVLGDLVDGVFAGLGGVYLVNELDRGAVGSMPAPPVIDRICAAYRQYEQGDADSAQSVLDQTAGYFTLELLYNVGVIKHVLHRRGIISSTACRVPAPKMDAVDLANLQRVLPA